MWLDGFLRFIRAYLRRSIRFLRLGVYLVFVFAFLSFLGLRALYAQVNEAAAALGRELADLPDLTREAEAIHINGARMFYSRAFTQESVEKALDRIEEHCRKHLGPLGEALGEMAARYPDHFETHTPRGFRSAVMRHDDAKSGVVICLTDDRVTGLSELPAILARFAETWDVSELGLFRYAYAERRDDTTLVVTTWTDGELNLAKMFPATGDAQGVDSDMVPRPPASRRTLSAAAEGMPIGVRIYESAQAIGAVRSFYETWFEKSGWVSAARVEGGLAYFNPDGYQVILTLLEDHGKTYATLVEAGSLQELPIGSVEVSE